MIDSTQVAEAHNAMAQEYDRLDDMWYPWLYAQVHEMIARNLSPALGRRRRALDVGCGTGFQSLLLARAGYEVTGFDIAEELVAVARDKAVHHARSPMEAPPLFETKTWRGAESHHRRLARRLEQMRGDIDVTPPHYLVADAEAFDYGRQEYDVITCCGSVLSFIDSYGEVLRRIGQSLRPGGFLFLEVEQKVNLDLLWPAVDLLSGGRLGYEQSWSEVVNGLFSPPGQSVQVEYPFELHSGVCVTLPIWIFAVADLRRKFKESGLVVRDRLGVHWATNVIPSTVLHRHEPGAVLRSSAAALMRIDAILGRCWPMWRLGCSVVYCLHPARR
jgi:SAM-dependent methyltransferase